MKLTKLINLFLITNLFIFVLLAISPTKILAIDYTYTTYNIGSLTFDLSTLTPSPNQTVSIRLQSQPSHSRIILQWVDGKSNSLLGTIVFNCLGNTSCLNKQETTTMVTEEQVDLYKLTINSAIPMYVCQIRFPSDSDNGCDENSQYRIGDHKSIPFQLHSEEQKNPSNYRSSGGAIDFTALEGATGLKLFGRDSILSRTPLGTIISAFLPYIFGAAGILLFLYLIWGGFGIMTSRGDPKALESARGRITTAIIGFVIIFIAYWLVQLLGLILNISQFGQVFK